MRLYDGLKEKKEKLALVGLGYVGMPIAVAFAKHFEVIGFDMNSEKIEKYRSGIDPTEEVGDEEISRTTVDFTDDEKKTEGSILYHRGCSDSGKSGQDTGSETGRGRKPYRGQESFERLHRGV